MVSNDRQLRAQAREIVDSNRYMTLATADGRGQPWASPVWYAHDSYTEFLWASKPDARHSRNIAARPEVGIVIFDSTVPEGDAVAVYLEASGEELTGSDAARAVATYSRKSEAAGLSGWTTTDITAPAAHRLYRATASEHFLLGANDQRISLELGP